MLLSHSSFDADTYIGPESGAPIARDIIDLYKAMKTLYSQFDNDDGILLASSCTFKPRGGVDCTGGVTDFVANDGARRLMDQAQHFENVVFPTYDLAGNRITPAHRFLACTATFSAPDCAGSCDTCTGLFKPKCLARQLKCKANNTPGLSFPFSKCVCCVVLLVQLRFT